VGNVPGDEDRIIYIEVKYLTLTNFIMPLKGEISPRKRVFFGGLYCRKWGLAFFWG
jgi:hypothetical protein